MPAGGYIAGRQHGRAPRTFHVTRPQRRLVRATRARRVPYASLGAVSRSHTVRHAQRIAAHRRRVAAKRARISLRQVSRSRAVRHQTHLAAHRRRVRAKQARIARHSLARVSHSQGVRRAGRQGLAVRSLRSTARGTVSPYAGLRTSGKVGTRTQWPAALTVAALLTGGTTAHQNVPRAVGHVLRTSGRDALQLAANTPESTYNVGAATAEALFGHDTHRARQLFHSFKETDPFALAFQGRFKEAGHAVTEHPVSFALELLGGKGAIGRGIGRAERLTGVGHGRYRRGDAVLEGTKARQIRHHSRDAITMRRERHFDNRAARAAAKLSQEADRHFELARTEPHNAARHLEKGAELRRKSIHRSPHHMTNHQIRRRVDERNAANEDVRRQLRTLAVKSAKKHHVPERKGGHLVALVAQNIIHATPEDVRAYIRELDHEHRAGLPSRAEEIANRKLRASLKRAVDNPKTDWKRIEAAARGYAKDMAPVERELVERGLVDARQSEKARLIPYAVRRMGARRAENVRVEASPQRLAQIGTRVGELEQVFERHAKAAQAWLGERDQFKAEAEWAKAERARKELGKLRNEAGERSYTGMVDAHGHPLSSEQIRAHMDEHFGGRAPEPAFLSHSPTARGARNFFLSANQRHLIKGKPRTGEAVRRGTLDSHPDTLVEAAARAHGYIASDHGFKGMIDEFAIRSPHTGEVVTYRTKEEADRFVREALAQGSRPLRAVRANPFLAAKKDMENLLEEVNAATPAGPIAESLPEPMIAAMESAMRGSDGPGPWVVLHDVAAKRFADHLKQLGPAVGLRGIQRVNQAFRNTVLPLSTKWLTGNVVEAGFRTAIARAGPISYITGSRMFKRHELLTGTDRHPDEAALVAQAEHAQNVAGRWEALAEQRDISPHKRRVYLTEAANAARQATTLEARARGALEAPSTEMLDRIKSLEANVRTRGGGHFSMAERESVRRSADQFNDSMLEPLARALGATARAPGVKHLGKLWGAYTHAVFGLNSHVERMFQTALAGKYAREFMLAPAERATMERAVDQAARGLMNTNEQVAMGRFVDRAYGRYGKRSPTEKALVAYYTPFISWSLNAAHFVLWALPKDHPVATGLAAAATNASEPWLREHGLYLWASGHAPGWLQGSIPVGAGKLRISRYLPFGAFTDPADTASSLLIPQYMSAVLALKGLDWTGRPLGGFGASADTGQKFGAALDAFFGATIPVAAQIRQVASKKEGSLGAKLRSQFDPFKPVAPKGSEGGGKGGPFNFKDAVPQTGGLHGFDFKNAVPVK